MAYVLSGYQWPVGSIVKYYINANTAQVGDEDTVVKSAAHSWSLINPPGLQLSYGGMSSAKDYSYSGFNTVCWKDEGNNGTLATSYIWYSGGTIFETDLVFNDFYNWSNSGDDYDIESVALHEFGHWIGLDHSSTGIMTAYYDGIQHTIDNDAIAGFIALYGGGDGKQYSIVVSSGPGGTTDPSPGTYIYNGGTKISVTAVPYVHYRFKNWSGDASGTENPITITIDSDKAIKANFIRIIYPPLNFKGVKVLNRSLSQAEYINTLAWQANPHNVNIVSYRIYRIQGGNKILLVELDKHTFEYWDRKIDKDKLYTYVLVAVNNEEREGDPATVTT